MMLKGYRGSRQIRFVFSVAFLLVALSLDLHAGVVGFNAIPLGENSYRYDYQFFGFTLQANQEIEIRFDPLLYKNVHNEQSGSDFKLVLAPPLNPPETVGFYSILALIDDPSFAAQFSVDFTFLGSGLPGAQPYRLNQFLNGRFDHTIENGTTAPVPEPSAWLLTLTGLAGSLAVWAVRRHSS